MKKSVKGKNFFKSVHGNSRTDSLLNRNLLLSMFKRSQVTVFVIIAVVLVAVAGVALFATKDANRPDDSRFFAQANAKPELLNVRSAILGCRDNAVKDSLVNIGVQGGYSDKPANVIDLGWTFIPYYYMEGKYAFPQKAFVEKEFGKEIDKTFTKCINDLSFEGFSIDKKTSKTKAIIKNKEVDIKIDMPISIKKDDSVFALEMKDAPVIVNSSLFDIIEVAGYIVESHKNDSKMLCVTCVADMAEERNLYVNAFDLMNNSVLYVISENYTSDEPYSYEFLNRYPAPEVARIAVPSVPSAARRG